MPRTTEVEERRLEIDQCECRLGRCDEVLRGRRGDRAVMQMQADASPTRLDEPGDLCTIGDAESRSAMATTVEDRPDRRIAAGDRCRDPDRATREGTAACRG